jgi:lactate dehydrogenase-like 2-hydroxyacid dehydrogenase
MNNAGKPRVFVTRRMYPFLVDELKAACEVDLNQEDRALSPEEFAQRLARADGALTFASERVDEAVLAHAERLRIVANVAVGYNNFDLPAFTRHGVLATNTPNVLNESVADHALALLLAAARRIGESERWLRAGHWKRWEFDQFPGADLHGRTLGIIGLGRIGHAIARRASGFSMRVLYNDVARLPAGQEAGAQWASREELLRQADHVIVMVPYLPSTHHLIGEAELALMKPTAVFVNLARGGVVDDAALVRALRDGRLAAAGLDVFENEPQLNPGFLELENVVMTPHIASSTRATREAMARLAMRNLAEALAGSRPPCLLNPDVWDNRRR